MTQAFVPPEFVRDVTERYAVDGYRPASPSRLPVELSTGGADLIFERGDQIVLVEFKRSNRFVPAGAHRQLTTLASQVRNFPNVRLDIINLPDPIDVLPDTQLIESRANAAVAILEGASDARALEAALLLAASASEGALIRLLRARQILVPSGGIATLAATAWSEGLMTQAQWDRLQRSIDRRNAVAHGLTSGVPLVRDDVDTFVELALTFSDPAFQTALDLVNWFFEHYESPAERMPYDSSEGGYQYIEGGPFDAAEVLAQEFSDAPAETLALAVEQIEGYGLEWVKVQDE